MNSFCQVSAMFETAFYFEDGIGNKDTVYLKQDPSIETYSSCVTCDEIDIQEEYGEDYLTIPFDSIFEVRAAHELDYNDSYDQLTQADSYKFQKTVVMSTSNAASNNPSCYYLGRGLVFIMRIKNLPLKVTYDADFFKDPCNVYNYFSNTYYFFQAAECEPDEIIECFQNPPEDEFFECMNTGYFEYYFDKKYGEEVLGVIDELALINDGTIDTLEFLQIEFGFQPLTPCHNILSATEEVGFESNNNVFDVYPNPASIDVTLGFTVPQEMRIEIFGMTGNLVLSKEVSRTEDNLHINTTDYAAGIYFYTAYDTKNRIITNGRFLVGK